MEFHMSAEWFKRKIMEMGDAESECVGYVPLPLPHDWISDAAGNEYCARCWAYRNDQTADRCEPGSRFVQS